LGPTVKLTFATVFVRPSAYLSVRLHGCIVTKRRKIGLRLLLITNRKSHIGFQITCKLSTLDDIKGKCLLVWLNGAK